MESDVIGVSPCGRADEELSALPNLERNAPMRRWKGKRGGLASANPLRGLDPAPVSMVDAPKRHARTLAEPATIIYAPPTREIAS